jgi:HK97 gp10 family phage protein
MADVAMDLRGLEDLRRKLGRMSAEVANSVAQPALMAAAQPVVKEARVRAPRRTGRGAASIEAASRRQGAHEFQVAVGPSVGAKWSRREGFYLLFVERGTGPRHTKSGAFRGRMIRKPFLRPALDAKRAEAIGIARRELWEGIRRAAR